MRIQVVTAKRLWETECLAFLNQRERIDATGKHTYKYSPNPQCAKVLSELGQTAYLLHLQKSGACCSTETNISNTGNSRTM